MENPQSLRTRTVLALRLFCCQVFFCHLPGCAQSHGFEYKRNGTLGLFAALNMATGEVVGKMAQRHTSQQLLQADTMEVRQPKASSDKQVVFVKLCKLVIR